MQTMRRYGLGLCVFTLVFNLCLTYGQGVITTFAGSTQVFRGDGRPATSATLGRIMGLALDSAGNLYASDESNQILVKISPAGVLTVVAGNGINGFSGDGGAATAASLSQPAGVAVDSAGNLYVAEFLNNRVRKIDASGRITTIAGDGVGRYTGDGGPAGSASLNEPEEVLYAPDGSLYIADAMNGLVRRILPSGIITTVAGAPNTGLSGDGGPATAASLSFPSGLALDSAGNLYIAEAGNNRVRKVSPGGIITTVAGTGALSFSGDGGPAINAALQFPTGVAVDLAGNLYIADSRNQRIRKVGPDGRINTIAGTGTFGFSGDGGPASGAQLGGPRKVLADSTGNIYVADSGNFLVRKINPAGIISTIAGNGLYGFSGDGGPATRAALLLPTAVAADGAGNVYISDTNNARIRRFGPGGIISTVAGSGYGGSSGDGGPATAAKLGAPWSVAVDSAGNVYIAETDNHRVRKVDPSGSIRTVAGVGIPGYFGEGVPATMAVLNSPYGVAVDAAGNLYIADSRNFIVRMVNRNGIIGTIAGLGLPAFFGDNGPAYMAALGIPWSLSFDAVGNLYIADVGNQRIRKVGTNGIITTVAGTGAKGFSGDGGPAVAAALNGPYGVGAGAGGEFYIADNMNNRVRKVSANGIISTLAGNGVAGFFGDGGSAAGSSLSAPFGVAVDAAGNVYIADSGSNRVRKVAAAAPSLSATPASLSFSVPGGSTSSAAQPITVSSSLTGLTWGAQASTDSGNWLVLSANGGSAPGTVAVSVNTANLDPGTYRGRVTVDAAGAAPSSQSVAVELKVESVLPAKLSVEPTSVNFEAASGAGQPPVQTLRIGNGGGGALSWTARPETASGGNWLSLSAASGSTPAGSPAAIQASANAAGLAPGAYSGSVRVQAPAAGQEQVVAVTLLVTKVTQTILVSQNGLLFTGVEGGGAAPGQSVGILNTGQGTMSWTVEVETLAGGNWLSASPASGRSDAGSTQIPMVEIGANAAGLKAGQYSGLVRVVAGSADNSPQLISVTLNVLAAGSNPGVVVRPTGLIFAARAGTFSPGSQTVRAGTAAPGSVDTRVFGATFDRGNWLKTAPENLTLAPGESRSITVQPDLGSLAPKVYRGALTLLFGDGSPSQTVDILFVVAGSAGAGASGVRPTSSSAEGAPPFAETCAPQRLLAAFRSLGNNFAISVGWPSLIEAQVMDDCGSPVTNAGVAASFSNGDPPLALTSLRSGIYTGTWQPGNVANQLTVTLRASAAGLAAAEVKAQGQLSGNQKTPALYSGGVVSGASFAKQQAVAPGSIVSVFGMNMASGLNRATRLPLETSLGGATLNIGGQDAPLFFSSEGQINAQIPFELTPNTRHGVVLKARGASGAQMAAVPASITVTAAQPAIFTINQQGTGQAAILDKDGNLVDASAPAGAGDVIQVFCTGLGITQPAVRSGEPAPSAEPLAKVVTQVEARIGGRPAVVHFAGLAPTFVGLYQVNLQIPDGVTPGNDVPLVLLQNGTPSNTVTLAVR